MKKSSIVAQFALKAMSITLDCRTPDWRDASSNSVCLLPQKSPRHVAEVAEHPVLSWSQSLMIHIFVLFHALMFHLLELRLLIGREHSVDLIVCCLVNCFLFGCLLLWGKRRIVAE